MKENNSLSSTFATILISGMFNIDNLDKARNTVIEALTDDSKIKELAELLNVDESSVKIAINNLKEVIKEQGCTEQL